MKNNICIALLFFLFLFELKVGAQSEIDTQKIEDVLEFSKKHDADEILIEYKGEILCHWINEHCEEKVWRTASMVKSWTAIIIGMMVDQKLIESEEEPVCKYLPEWADGCKHNVTIKNLLTMSAGFIRRPGSTGILPQQDMNAYVLNTLLDTFPDVRFQYSNESVQLLGILIEKVTGKSANEYFTEVLFHPLGMKNTQLTKDQSGNYIVFGGAQTTVEDALAIGIVMKNKGVYNGKQILSEKWIEKSTQPSKNANYYGYLWWLDNNSDYKNYAATGDFGQMTIVFPELDMIFMRRQSCNKIASKNMTWMGPQFLQMLSEVVVN